MNDLTFSYHLGMLTGFVFGMFASPVVYTVVKMWVTLLKRKDDEEGRDEVS